MEEKSVKWLKETSFSKIVILDESLENQLPNFEDGITHSIAGDGYKKIDEERFSFCGNPYPFGQINLPYPYSALTPLYTLYIVPYNRVKKVFTVWGSHTYVIVG